jgi:two-component system, sensor histidine kinase RegB
MPAETPDHRAEISLGWLVRLRWGAVVGQTTTIGLALVVFHAPLPLERLGGLVAALFGSNLGLVWARRFVKAPRPLCGAALSFDALQLTGLLWTTGGAANPFSVLYLVYITLAAVVLGARWTWSLAALCVACYGLLFVTHVPVEHLAHLDAGMQLHLQGMWLAFCVAAGLTAYFVVQMSTAIERSDRELAATRERAARSERLASLATLAAGAAHELGTPLATIAVAAKELERSIQGLPEARTHALLEDAVLIRSELDRCRDPRPPGGRRRGGAGRRPHGVRRGGADGGRRGGSPRLRSRVTIHLAGEPMVHALRGALLQFIRNLVRNALDARAECVGVRLEATGSSLTVVVDDDGRGMPPDVLARVGEPFFTTKGRGAGLGLGVFLARSLCEQMGGRLILESTADVGTTARAEVPTPAVGRQDG